jgi:hypothetical protein
MSLVSRARPVRILERHPWMVRPRIQASSAHDHINMTYFLAKANMKEHGMYPHQKSPKLYLTPRNSYVHLKYMNVSLRFLVASYSKVQHCLHDSPLLQILFVLLVVHKRISSRDAVSLLKY